MKQLSFVLVFMMCFVMILIPERSNAAPPEFAGNECEQTPIRRTSYIGAIELPGANTTGTIYLEVFPQNPEDQLLIIESINYTIDGSNFVDYHNLLLRADFEGVNDHRFIFVDKVPDPPPEVSGIRGNFVQTKILLKESESLHMQLSWWKEEGSQIVQEIGLTVTGYLVDATCINPF